MSVTKAFGSIVLSMFVLTGCFHAEDASIDGQCPELAETFFQKSLKDQMAEFPSYELRNQYAIFICGNQAVHPPAQYLAGAFAQDGPKAVEFLRGKLKNAKGDLTIRDITLVFAEMNRLKTYDVAGDKELINLLTEKINGMKSEWKVESEQLLTEIDPGR